VNATTNAAATSVEITDLLVDIDPRSGVRRPVAQAAVVQRLIDQGDARAARVVRALPATDGVLDDHAVDRLVVAVHQEIQRLSEEFRHGARMARLIAPLLAGMRTGGVPGPYRIVDIGCGTGYVVRWLSRFAAADDVTYVGVDHHEALVLEARRLAQLEHLPCRFEVADAFTLAEPAHLFLSTGVLHHLAPRGLDGFFAQHEAGPALGFVHVDFQPSAIAPFGAWLFHRTRMRLPVSRFDGVRSARRAHDPAAIEASASTAAPSFTTSLVGQRIGRTPLPCVLTSLVGVRHGIAGSTVAAHGLRASDRRTA
jgi:SAM-dependent methyltransferase